MEGTHAILLLRGVKYTADDFDEMRTIICEQNALELPRDDVHPDIKKAWEEVEDLRRKRAKVKICSFGDQMNVMMKNILHKTAASSDDYTDFFNPAGSH